MPTHPATHTHLHTHTDGQGKHYMSAHHYHGGDIKTVNSVLLTAVQLITLQMNTINNILYINKHNPKMQTDQTVKMM